MVPEAPVFDRDDGGGQEGGKLVQSQRLADHVTEGGDDLSRTVFQGQAGAADGV
jgi:hypothetical protein